MSEANGPEGSIGNDGASDNRAALGGTSGEGSNGGNETWVAGLQAEENRTLVEAKQWQTADDALKSYRELEAEYKRNSLKVPGKDATAEDWDAFYSKIGRPEKADGYTFTLDRDNLPSEFPYDETAATEFKNVAHKAGLNPGQAAALHDWFVQSQAGRYSETVKSRETASDKATSELTKAWGDLDTDGFKQQISFADRAMRELGIKDSLVNAGVIDAQGTVFDAGLAKALARVGKEMFAEDSLYGSGAMTGENPFKSGDPIGISAVLRSDPKRAKALATAAGKDPAKWGL